VLLPILRMAGVVAWPWAVAFAPFTILGVGFAGGLVWIAYRHEFEALLIRFTGAPRGGAGATPAPDHLDPPRHATDSDTRILAQHPEILAALCHGFRMKQLLPTVLGRPVTDPWGVYEAALTAPADELAALDVLAAAHTARFAETGRRFGKRPSDAHAMRQGLLAFRRCAQKAEHGRSHPDCPFEHVTVIYGARSPARDANLKSVAPKVRALLERQYPQLKTARLADGSQVKFEDWQKEAAKDRADLDKLRKELDREARDIEALRSQLEEERAVVARLRDAADAQRAQARDAARAQQEQAMAELRAALDRTSADAARELQRFDTERARLVAAAEAVTEERDALERALFLAGTARDGDDDDGAVAALDTLQGVRVLLVGGEPRQIPPLREHLESLGAQLVHEDSVAAAELVARAHVVVFWIRYLSHPKYFGVRQKVRALRATHCYWMQTSPASLAGLVARTVAGPGAGAEDDR
jgi:hypothetical protein